ncbi:LOW QUALITY PROTEIN: neuromedin-U receptor 1 [Ctenodactylus gundi]
MTMKTECFDPEDLNLTDGLKLKCLGPQQTELFVPICATYLLITVVGTVGNSVTYVVILSDKALTPTDIFGLAVSDPLVLPMGLTLELYEMWHTCPCLTGNSCYFPMLPLEMVYLASVLNVTALSVRHYVAIALPLTRSMVMRAVCTAAHVHHMLGAIWAIVICSLPNTSLHGRWQLQVPCGPGDNPTVCTLACPRALYNLVVQITALFCLPMASINVLHLLLELRLQWER